MMHLILYGDHFPCLSKRISNHTTTYDYFSSTGLATQAVVATEG